jgi:hypothetical protein
MIQGSGSQDWVCSHFFTITVSYNSSYIELLLNDVCLTHHYEESLTNLRLISATRIHESTAFYNRYATRMEVTMSHISSVLFCYGNYFV